MGLADTSSIDGAKESLNCTNPNWTGPHPDFALHVIGVMIEAVGRDIVQAIADLSADVTKAIKEVADAIE